MQYNFDSLHSRPQTSEHTAIEMELALSNKAFFDHIGDISGKDFTGKSLRRTPGRPRIAALSLSIASVP